MTTNHGSASGILHATKKEGINPETKTVRIGKLDNSASMQRAIERVSRERMVKKNDPPSVQRKTKVVVGGAGTETTTGGGVSSLKVSSARSVTGGVKRSKALETSKSLSKHSSSNGAGSSSSVGTISTNTTCSSSSSGSSTVSSGTSHSLKHVKDASQGTSVSVKKKSPVKLEHTATSSHGLKSSLKQVDVTLLEKNVEPCEVLKQEKQHVSFQNETAKSVPETEEQTRIRKDALVSHQQNLQSEVNGGTTTTAVTGGGDDDDDRMSGDVMSSSDTTHANRNADAASKIHNDEGRDARDITRKLITDILRDENDELSFEFQGFDVPVTYSAAVSYESAAMALESSAFSQWQDKMNRVVGPKRLEIRHVDIHTVDFVDDRVDMIKMSTTCVLIDEELQTEQEVLSGVCYLRDNYVALLIELFCVDDESSWAILVDKPLVPIGSVTALELPVGKVDEEEERLLGFEIQEIEEAFGLELNLLDMTNLSKEAYGHTVIHNDMGMCPSPGQSGEHVKIMYLKKEISRDHLLMMRAKFSKQREEGALVSLRVIPLHEMWKVSIDMKVMCALFLLQKSSHEDDHLDDDMSVSIRGRRLVSSVLSSVCKGALLPSKSMEM